MKYLNLGCGTRYLPEWTNVDFFKTSDSVVAHDLTLGIPYAENSFDVVYHSHILEHFQKKQAELFLRECFRVLNANGIIRIAVPDLEQIARLYIQQLEIVRIDPNQLNKANYEWSLIEMFDQIIRNDSGGAMGKYWSKKKIINEDWIIQRAGVEYLNYKKNTKNSPPFDEPTITQKAKFKLKNSFYFSSFRRCILNWLFGEPKLFELLELARFRTGGEIHQWMYDSYSLSELLKTIGFKEINKVDAYSSRINDWSSHQWLDVENGKVRKPDSLFIEAIKPVK
jgi:predicted SAM-dependent methyltransferase